MDAVLLVLSLVVLLVIAWQDFRSRQIHALALLAVLGLGIWGAYESQEGMPIWSVGLVNGAMVMMMLALTFLIWKFVLGRGGLIDKALGLGDALLLLAFSCWAAPMQFMIAVLVGFVLGIVMPNRGKTIPLASWLAVSFGLMLLLDEVGVIESRYSLYF